MQSSHTDRRQQAEVELAIYSPDTRELLRAVRDLVRADRAMRRDLGYRMHMNSNELLAVRHVLDTSRQGDAPTPRGLARFLGISTASTTTLVDGLVASGHLQRQPNPADGRSKVLVATPAARQHVHEQLGGMHERMRDVAEAVPADARPAIIAFLQELTVLMQSADSGSPTPRTGDQDDGARQS